MGTQCVVLFRTITGGSSEEPTTTKAVEKVYGPLTTEAAGLIAMGLRAQDKDCWVGPMTKANGF